MSHMHILPDCECLRPLLEMPTMTTLKAQKRVLGIFSYYAKFINNFSDKIHVLNNNSEFLLPEHDLSFSIFKR